MPAHALNLIFTGMRRAARVSCGHAASTLAGWAAPGAGCDGIGGGIGPVRGGWTYFAQITVASPRLTPSAVAQGLKELRETAALLIGGLAARLGGKAFPESARLREPLHADVYSPRALTTAELSALLEPYAPGLAPAEGPWTADGVTTLHSDRGQIDVEYWPPSIPLMTMDPPAALGGLRDQRQQLNVTVIRSAHTAADADPGTARAVAAPRSRWPPRPGAAVSTSSGSGSSTPTT
jgi:hypothetical protein